jgi:hypothetical protein
MLLQEAALNSHSVCRDHVIISDSEIDYWLRSVRERKPVGDKESERIGFGNRIKAWRNRDVESL